MIVHSIYESDNREVIRYANALAESAATKWMCWRSKRDKSLADVETVGKVRVHRLQLRMRKDQRGRGPYLLPLLKFWVSSSAWLTWKHLWNRYDAIHVHNVPDCLVFRGVVAEVDGSERSFWIFTTWCRNFTRANSRSSRMPSG